MGSIVLTGFMATGKSEVGRRLARVLGRTFVDTDRLVEAEAGRSVAQVFASAGESAFRALERAAVERACAMPDAVIATGGGTLMDPESRQRLSAAGPIVCLTASPDTILRRVGESSSRPLLAGAEDRLERIRTLLQQRKALYGAATHTVDTTGLTVEQVVERVRDLVENG